MATNPSADIHHIYRPERLRTNLANRGEATFKGDLQEIVEALQADRRQSLEATRRMHLAAQLLLQGEAARLAAFAPDDLRVAALRAGAARAVEQSQFLADEAALAAVRIPMVRKTEALMHGRVTDDANRPAGPVTVTLVDAAGKPVEGVAPVAADSAGYYALVVPAEVAARLPQDARYAVAVQHGAERIAPRFEAQPLKAGAVHLQDVALTDEQLKKLKVRSEFPELRPREADHAKPPGKAAAPRKAARHAGEARPPHEPPPPQSPEHPEEPGDHGDHDKPGKSDKPR